MVELVLHLLRVRAAEIPATFQDWDLVIRYACQDLNSRKQTHGYSPSPPSYQMPEHPSGNFADSMRMGIHTESSHRLERCLNKLKTDYYTGTG